MVLLGFYCGVWGEENLGSYELCCATSATTTKNPNVGHSI